jgi:hypothetical protein
MQVPNHGSSQLTFHVEVKVQEADDGSLCRLAESLRLPHGRPLATRFKLSRSRRTRTVLRSCLCVDVTLNQRK